jgi:hypothetical protein
MSGTITHYTIYCNTESAFIPTWSINTPTTCPHNIAHDVNAESASSSETIDIGPIRSVTAADSPVALTATEGIVSADATAGDVTLNLPDATLHKYKMYYVVKTDNAAHSVYVDGFDGQTVGGVFAHVLSAQNQDVTLISDGTNWSTNPDDIKFISNTYVSVNEDEQTVMGKKTYTSLLFDVNDPEHLKNGGGIVLRSPNGNRWALTVDNSGAVVVTGV